MVYPDELQVTDADFVFNFVATYHMNKTFIQNTMVFMNFSTYKNQTGFGLNHSGQSNCTNLTWSKYTDCQIPGENVTFKWIVNYTKREDKI